MALSSRKMIKKFAPIPVAGFAANQYFRAKSAGRDFGRPQNATGRIRASPTANRGRKGPAVLTSIKPESPHGQRRKHRLSYCK